MDAAGACYPLSTAAARLDITRVNVTTRRWSRDALTSHTVLRFRNIDRAFPHDITPRRIKPEETRKHLPVPYTRQGPSRLEFAAQARPDMRRPYRADESYLALSVRASRCSQRYSRVHELDRARQQREEHEEERREGGDLSRQIQPRVLVGSRQIRRALEENDQQAKVKQNRVVARNDRLPQTSRVSRWRQCGAWRGAGRGEGRHTHLEPQQQQPDTGDNPRCACGRSVRGDR